MLWLIDTRVPPYISHIRICLGMFHPSGFGFCSVSVQKQVYTLLILVWNRVWFSRELWGCINVIVISIPNEWERRSHASVLKLPGSRGEPFLSRVSMWLCHAFSYLYVFSLQLISKIIASFVIEDYIDIFRHRSWFQLSISLSGQDAHWLKLGPTSTVFIAVPAKKSPKQLSGLVLSWWNFTASDIFFTTLLDHFVCGYRY